MKQIRFFFFHGWLALGLVASAVAQPAGQAAQVPAAVSNPDQVLVQDATGEKITVGDIQAELMRIPEANRVRMLANPDGIQQVVSNLLVRRLLAKEAIRDGLDKDATVQASLLMAKDRVLSDARLLKIDQQNTPSEAALEAYARNSYQASGIRFDKPGQTRASHILIENKGPESLQKAKDLLSQLRAGASFEALAKEHSADPGSAARGGSLGFFGAGQMVRPFEDATNALQKPGDLSEPVESQFGYHIIRLDERREKGRQPFEEVRPVLINEARMALINDARTIKAESLSKHFVIDRPAIEALSKSAGK